MANPENNTPTILYVCNDLSYFLAHRYHVAQQAENEGWKTIILSDTTNLTSQERPETAVHIAIERRKISPITDIRAVLKIGTYIKQNPEIIHAITIKPILMVGLTNIIVSKTQNTSHKRPHIIMTFPGLGEAFRMHKKQSFKNWFRRKVIEWLYQQIFKAPNIEATFENADDAAYALKHFGIRAHAITITPGTGVDTTLYIPKQKSIPPAVKIGFAARLLRSKGVWDYVKVAKHLKTKHYDNPDLSFYIAGMPDKGNQQSITTHDMTKIQDQGITIYGFIKDMPSLLGETDIIVLPSTYREGIPRILIEAASCGCALIGYDIPGVREIIQNGINGYLIPPDDVIALSNAVESLITNAELRQNMQQNARKLIETNIYSTQNVSGKFLELYHNIS